jgi:hypothetical protein
MGIEGQTSKYLTSLQHLLFFPENQKALGRPSTYGIKNYFPWNLRFY